MTEEEIRGNLLLPFLNDLGCESSEISLERSFQIRLGRGVKVTGRSDILCKRHDKNLFVIELKRDSVNITQDDIDQGISYARLLLDDIAPFTIVTNGKITRIFDSISRKEISGSKISEQSSFWKNDYTLSTDEELRIRYEALKNFISLSPDNLNSFCSNQVTDRMGQIIGDINSPYSKFVKELHVQRKDLQNKFEEFISSDNSIFGLVGSAGTGKTNVFCSLALQSLEKNFVFFYNAAIINSPLESISQDLNLHFSGRSNSETVLKKLNEIGQYAKKNVLIFIDAIDENTNQNLTIELSNMALASRYLKKIKILISCKTNIWNSFLKPTNTPTHLYEELIKFHGITNALNNCPGYQINEFTDEELKDIIPLYQRTFEFRGNISNSLQENLKNGFFLRIFSEVYSQKQIPQKISDKELIKQYVNKSLEKVNIDKISALRILSRIGFILANHKYTERQVYKDEGIDLEYLLEQLNFNLDENIPEALFSRNLLIKSNKEESHNVTFYYSKIRDYIICFHSYKLDNKNNFELYDILDEIYENHIGQSAIKFYLDNSSENHKNTIIKYIEDKAIQYTIGYNSYLNTNFKVFKDKFVPKTKGDIGVVLSKDLLNNDSYSLFPLDCEPNNQLLYRDLSFNRNFYDDDLYQLNIETIYGSYIPLLTRDQSEIIKKNVFKQLKEFIIKGKISLYTSDILLLEQVSSILYFYSAKLDYDFDIIDFNLPRYNLIYPIDLNNLKHRINIFRLVEHFKRQGINRHQINELIEKTLNNNLEIPCFNVIGDAPLFEELYKIVNILLSKGYSKLESHHLPVPDKTISESQEIFSQNRDKYFRYIRSIQYSENQTKEYIKLFFKHLENSYKEVVENLFPTFKKNFDFYNSIPHEYFFYMKNENFDGYRYLGYRSAKSNEYNVYFKILEENIHEQAFEKDEIYSLQGFSLDSILYNDDYLNNRIKTIDKINTDKLDSYCVLRNWIYRLLKNDMRQLFKENGENI